MIFFLGGVGKSEEKMRVIHERKSQKLKRLDQWGAEAIKVDGTRKLVRSLSTRIRIAIQVVDKISVTINKIRDEELWPQLSELIQGYVKFICPLLCHCFLLSDLSYTLFFTTSQIRLQFSIFCWFSIK